MADASPPTAQLQLYLERMQAGDAAAREVLFRHACGRLERLTHKMLHGFPGVRRWEQADDVLQNALVPQVPGAVVPPPPVPVPLASQNKSACAAEASTNPSATEATARPSFDLLLPELN